MKVEELISKLQNMDPNAEVRVAGQPSYPMEQSFIGVAQTEAKLPDSDDECDYCDDARSNHPGGGECIAKDLDTDEPCGCPSFEDYDADENVGAVWLVVGDNIGYGVPRQVYDEAQYGW